MTRLDRAGRNVQIAEMFYSLGHSKGDIAKSYGLTWLAVHLIIKSQKEINEMPDVLSFHRQVCVASMRDRGVGLDEISRILNLSRTRVINHENIGRSHRNNMCKVFNVPGVRPGR